MGEESIGANRTALRRSGEQEPAQRWGSCSTHDRISLNCKLLFLPRDLVRYVMMRELCHVPERNHSEVSGFACGNSNPLLTPCIAGCAMHGKQCRHGRGGEPVCCCEADWWSRAATRLQADIYGYIAHPTRSVRALKKCPFVHVTKIVVRSAPPEQQLVGLLAGTG